MKEDSMEIIISSISPFPLMRIMKNGIPAKCTGGFGAYGDTVEN